MHLSYLYYTACYFNAYQISYPFCYRYVGKLVGRYYDSQGNPTKYLKGVEAKAARGAQLLEKQKIEEAKLPSCNSRWSQDEGGEVCTVVIVCNQFIFILLTDFISPNIDYKHDISSDWWGISVVLLFSQLFDKVIRLL